MELFNRPSDRGRIVGTLIFLDHSLEAFLKSAIVHRGARIRDKGSANTIGFDACVRRALSNAEIAFINPEQALVLQSLNGLRDAAQHYLLDISESQLYLHVQSGVTLFRDLLRTVFDRELQDYLPKRVLPVSTVPFTSLEALFDREIEEIKLLLQPRRRMRAAVEAKIRLLAILDRAIGGQSNQPGSDELMRMGARLAGGTSWQDIFQGVAVIEFAAEADPTISIALHLTKKQDGAPIQLVPEGTPSAAVVAVRRVNELDYYSLGARDVAGRLGITVPKLNAVANRMGLKSNDACYKPVRLGKTIFPRYSHQALQEIQTYLLTHNIDQVWLEERRAQRAVSQ